MRGRVVVLGAGVALLVGAVAAFACEGRELSAEELRSEATRNRELSAYLARNGLPDLAERRFLADAAPWDDHEVIVYYVRARKELAFARAWVLGRPEVHLIRYERALSDDQIATLRQRGNMEPIRMAAMHGSGPVARAQAAAERAEQAAARLEEMAHSAERAAGRAEAIALKMTAPRR